MPKKFIINVPCTSIDRYIIFADSEDDARRKMASGTMLGYKSDKEHGDYKFLGSADDEPETHWDAAMIIKEEPNA